MTNEQILKRAIQKAYKNGWVQPTIDLEETIDMYTSEEISWYELIFSHDFAKAFFGEKKELTVSFSGYCEDSEGNTNGAIDEAWRISEWQYHLQQMVLEENPIKYLEKFI